MSKIKKNLSDADMLVGWKEAISFESDVYKEDPDRVQTPTRAKDKPETKSFLSSFLTPELEEKIGKALLDLKLELYKKGTVDFTLKVSRDNERVIIQAVPVKEKKQTGKQPS
ncbi:hypothetical protein [Propionispora hippei]|uniref:Uncharacterized protein n=1 Tax=Propionispora hippei DSM 15287 TaxID=1123003 RepID=A0A1M6P0U3_9FIRM|nr:hypothetical protein [Propionispora hippei]SHK01530.1 hypothetical protein SAMN02745170_03925 [Propionispora hippei DSM 15287]